MSATGRIVVLADDLSGAAELAGIASGYGLTAEVQRRFDSTSAAEVVAVDCDSRSLPEELAARRVRAIAANVFANRPAWIFKKIDSVLRGHPRAEIEAILGVTGQPRALLIPANPSRGRIIAGGRYLMDGVPLDKTVFAHDPEFPRRSADVAALLGNGANHRIQLLGAADLLPPEGIAVPDVATVGDLERWAAAVDNSTLGAGAADFFAALIQHRSSDRRLLQKAVGELHLAEPALLVCGSPAAWTWRKEECREAGLSIVTLESNEVSGEQLVDAAASGLSASGVLVLASGGVAMAVQDRRQLLGHLANLTALVLERLPVATLLAEGGATAAALCDRIGWSRFAVSEPSPAGVGVLAPLFAGAAPRVFIKPGSYAWPIEIWQPFCQLRRS